MPSDQGQHNDKKRKRFDNARQQFGSRNKKKELGRGALYRSNRDKRTEDDAKRQKTVEDGATTQQRQDPNKPSILPGPYPEEEIAAEPRRPKHKVAVLIGYSGTGYRGMQINTTERTIEGDLFSAFVKAGAISKANANDPKKSGLVRCARTDKGVHAAGNVVSLKLIVEDADIVAKINKELSSQIRVWGIQRTVGSFSCYQACDSRWYEYLIPSHAFLPPHPNSFLGKKLVELAEEVGDEEGLRERQKECEGWWEETEEKYIKPILDGVEDAQVKEMVMKALYENQEDAPEGDDGADSKEDVYGEATDDNAASVEGNAPSDTIGEATAFNKEQQDAPTPIVQPLTNPTPVTTTTTTEPQPTDPGDPATNDPSSLPSARLAPATRRQIEALTRRLRSAYTTAKRAHRIPPARLDRIQTTLNNFLGTQNYHNYTISKAPRDPSAKRVIKSFKLDATPKIVQGTEWLSLKIHGQSFMMHQIRKMVSAVALVVRSGCPPSRIAETLRADVSVSIPKVPGLGLLLERPVFESYNEHAAKKFEREELSFERYEGVMEEFKQREIYERIFREEEEGGQFGTFFGHVDGFREGGFLWVSSKGVAACTRRLGKGEGAGAGGAKGEEGRGTGANGQAVGMKTTAAGSAGSAQSTQIGGVDSEDEEDVEERGRADMDG